MPVPERTSPMTAAKVPAASRSRASASTRCAATAIKRPPDVWASDSPSRTASSTPASKADELGVRLRVVTRSAGNDAFTDERQYAVHERHAAGIDRQRHVRRCSHCAGVAEQPEAGDVRCGPDGMREHRLRRPRVQGRHPAHGFVECFGDDRAALERRR